MNKVILIGNLTRDPEMRTTQGGVNVCTLGIAVQRRFANQQGVREADFFNVVCWRQLARERAQVLKDALVKLSPDMEKRISIGTPKVPGEGHQVIFGVK